MSIENLKTFGKPVHFFCAPSASSRLRVLLRLEVVESLGRLIQPADISTDPFAEAEENTGETKQSQNYIHIRIQRMLQMLKSPVRS